MAWTDNDLKIFAAGLAIGGKYNHTHGTLPRVKSSVASGTYSSVFNLKLSCDLALATIMYSIDGSTPTTIYSGEDIYVGDDLVCYAYAIYGQNLSPMSKFVYIIYIPYADAVDNIAFFGDIIDDLSINAMVNTYDVNDTFYVPIFTFSDDAEVMIS